MTPTALGAPIEVKLPDSPPSKFEREKAAFYRLLPELRTSHAGQYVAIHDEQVIDAGPDQVEVALRVQRRIGAVPVYVHLVSDNSRPACRSGMLRDLSRPGSDS